MEMADIMLKLSFDEVLPPGGLLNFQYQEWVMLASLC